LCLPAPQGRRGSRSTRRVGKEKKEEPITGTTRRSAPRGPTSAISYFRPRAPPAAASLASESKSTRQRGMHFERDINRYKNMEEKTHASKLRRYNRLTSEEAPPKRLRAWRGVHNGRHNVMCMPMHMLHMSCTCTCTYMHLRAHAHANSQCLCTCVRNACFDGRSGYNVHRCRGRGTRVDSYHPARRACVQAPRKASAVIRERARAKAPQWRCRS
jgi:hypothetical protein